MVIVKSLLRWVVVLAVFAGAEAGARNDLPAREPGPQQKEPGKVSFPVSCGPAAQSDFDHAMTLFHSAWYPQTVRPFTGFAVKYPDCGMAYWGIALSILHNPLAGHSMSTEALREGRAAACRRRHSSTGTRTAASAPRLVTI